MIDQLKSIGIEKGKPFRPDEATQSLLNAAAGEAHAEPRPGGPDAARLRGGRHESVRTAWSCKEAEA